MRFRLEKTMQALLDMERHLSDLRKHARALGDATDNGNLIASMSAAQSTRDTLRGIVATAISLRYQVVPLDDLGDTFGSVGELVVRAGRMALLAQLGRLHEATRILMARREVPPHAPAWRFQLKDVTALLHAELDRIDDLWLPRRDGADQAADQEGAGFMYRAAIRVSQHALSQLVDHAEVAQLLRAGIARGEWPDISRTCHEIVTLLHTVGTISVEAEAERLLGAASRRRPALEQRSPRQARRA
jgi:hypothetical protein